MEKAKRVRELFNGPGLVRIVGAHDGLSAKLVEKNGFDGVWASGLEISASYAVPDASILTMSQYLERACEMNDAVKIPVIADCDTGYGNSNNVMHMVRKYEAAGIAAVCIEDKKFPKENSLLPNGRQELATISEFTGKIMAAKHAQTSKDFMLIARVEALIAGWDEKEALLRAEKYVEVGADAILIHSKSVKNNEITSFARKWKCRAPLVIVPTTYCSITDKFSEKELLSLGIKMIIFANQGIRAGMKAIDKVFKEIRRVKGIHTIEHKIAPLEDIFKLQGMVDFKDQEKRYTRSENEDIEVMILCAGEPNCSDSVKSLIRQKAQCMIDINGKPLLKRNLDILRAAGLSKITVVVGYMKDKILKSRGLGPVEFIENNEFRCKGITHSLMLARQKMKGRTLVIYGDIFFDKGLITRILKLRGDIVLVGDNAYKKHGIRNKNLDLIRVSQRMITAKREIMPEDLLKISQIGKNLDEKMSDFEFTGIAFFSSEGIRSFKDLYKGQLRSKKGKFHEAKDFKTASFTDMLQEAVDKGLDIRLFPVSSGWTEVHDLEDYKFVCKKVKA